MTDGMKAKLPVLLRLLMWTGIIVGVFSWGMLVSSMAMTFHYEQRIRQLGLEPFFLDYPRWLDLSIQAVGLCAVTFLGATLSLGLWALMTPLRRDLREGFIEGWQILRGKDERTSGAK